MGSHRYRKCWMNFFFFFSLRLKFEKVLYFMTDSHIFLLKTLLCYHVELLSVASPSFPSSIKAQTSSSRPAVCLEPRLCRVQTAERSGSTPPLSLPLLSSLQLGAIILLLCVSVMGKKGPHHHWRGTGRQLYGVARS